jgi:hypothetical protein
MTADAGFAATSDWRHTSARTASGPGLGGKSQDSRQLGWALDKSKGHPPFDSPRRGRKRGRSSAEAGGIIQLNSTPPEAAPK